MTRLQNHGNGFPLGRDTLFIHLHHRKRGFAHDGIEDEEMRDDRCRRCPCQLFSQGRDAGDHQVDTAKAVTFQTPRMMLELAVVPVVRITGFAPVPYAPMIPGPVLLSWAVAGPVNMSPRLSSTRVHGLA